MSDVMSIPREKVQKEAIEILDDMAHSLNLKAVRGFAYVLVKVFKALFRRVYVNDEGIQRVINDN